MRHANQSRSVVGVTAIVAVPLIMLAAYIDTVRCMFSYVPKSRAQVKGLSLRKIKEIRAISMRLSKARRSQIDEVDVDDPDGRSLDAHSTDFDKGLRVSQSGVDASKHGQNTSPRRHINKPKSRPRFSGMLSGPTKDKTPPV